MWHMNGKISSMVGIHINQIFNGLEEISINAS